MSTWKNDSIIDNESLRIEKIETVINEKLDEILFWTFHRKWQP